MATLGPSELKLRCQDISLKYRKLSNIRRTQHQNLNDSRLLLQLSLPNQLKPGVKSITQM